MDEKNKIKKNAEMVRTRFGIDLPATQGERRECSDSANDKSMSGYHALAPDIGACQYSCRTDWKWNLPHMDGGTDALLLSGRSGKGALLPIPDDATARIVCLKGEAPRTQAAQIYKKLIVGFFQPAAFSACVLQRFLKNGTLKADYNFGTQDWMPFKIRKPAKTYLSDPYYFPCIAEDGRNRRTCCVMAVISHSHMTRDRVLSYNANAAISENGLIILCPSHQKSYRSPQIFSQIFSQRKHNKGEF